MWMMPGVVKSDKRYALQIFRLTYARFSKAIRLFYIILPNTNTKQLVYTRLLNYFFIEKRLLMFFYLQGI
jgi:hypothetical protein